MFHVQRYHTDKANRLGPLQWNLYLIQVDKPERTTGSAFQDKMCFILPCAGLGQHFGETLPRTGAGRRGWGSIREPVNAYYARDKRQ